MKNKIKSIKIKNLIKSIKMKNENFNVEDLLKAKRKKKITPIQL